jgi:hypothetical protein
MTSAPPVSSTDTGETQYSTTQQAIGQANGSATVSRLEIEPTKNGGYAVSCTYAQQNDAKGRSSDYQQPDKFAFSSFQELGAFLMQTFGQAPPADASGGGAPAADPTAPPA